MPENRTTAYSNPLQISNRIPYHAVPKGCAHMDMERITAMTFPSKCCGVSVWIKDMICTVKTVEHTITKKQQTVKTI